MARLRASLCYPLKLEGQWFRKWLAKRLITLPSLQEPPSNQKFPKLSTAERSHCVTRVGSCFDRRFEKHLSLEPDAMIVAWRRTMATAGGIDASARPLLRLLTSRASPGEARKPSRRNHKDGAGAVSLPVLLAVLSQIL